MTLKSDLHIIEHYIHQIKNNNIENPLIEIQTMINILTDLKKEIENKLKN